MKTKIIKSLIAFSLVFSLIGCGKTNESTSVSDNTAEETQEIVSMANPVEDVTYEKIVEVTECSVTLPENMENPSYQLISGELGQILFSLDNGAEEMTFRCQKSTEFTDISGLYYDWTSTEDVAVLDYETKQFAYDGEDENIKAILWFNQYCNVMYSLSASGKDLSAFDIYTIAANMAMTDVPLENYPINDFEARVGKTEFDSYDEIISLLSNGEAYSLVKMSGYDGDVLLVASGAYDNWDGNMAAIDATAYTVKASGKVSGDSVMSCGGTAYPLAIDDKGLIYCCGHHEVTAYSYGANGTDNPGLMIMKTISVSEFDENGDPKTVIGFYRDPSNISVIDDDTTDYAENDVEALNEAFEEYEKTTVVNFTVVE